MIITIDGYAGSGKSTAARELAAALGFDLLNTGSMYRAVAWRLRQRGIDIYEEPPNFAAIEAEVASLNFTWSNNQVVIAGETRTEYLESEEAGRGASRVGLFRQVRLRLQQEQRRIADQRNNIVCEGRDQGTAVFPDAPVKFFFHARPEVRAARRVKQLREKNLPADPEIILRQICQRDYEDTHRELDALRPAADAIQIDTSEQSPQAVLAFMMQVVERCRSRS
jgi:cytidylate kinase